MKLPVRLRVAAEQDIAELSEYLQRESVETALSFLDAVDATFALLADSPELGGQCSFARPEHAGLRVFRVVRFRRHLIFYRPANDEVEVVRILHGARDLRLIFGEEVS